MTRLEMTRAEVREALRANIGKKLRITLDDGIVQSVDIGSVDDEGFHHSGPDGDQRNHNWTRFEEVKHIHRRLSPYGTSMPNSFSMSAPKWVTLGLPRRKSLFR
jgi:hypothetical protein